MDTSKKYFDHLLKIFTVGNKKIFLCNFDLKYLYSYVFLCIKKKNVYANRVPGIFFFQVRSTGQTKTNL